MGSFRRCVFLVMDEIKSSNYLLRRLDVGRLFLSNRLPNPPAMEERQLPAAEITFDRPPLSGPYIGIRTTRFLLLGGRDGSRDEKVVSIDPLGRALCYDTERRTVRALHSFAGPKFAPVSVTDGKNLFIMDSLFTPSLDRDKCFEALIYDRREEDWHPCCLPAPPYAPWFRNELHSQWSHAVSYALVDGGDPRLWFSSDWLGTHCFDLARDSWSKVGDWAVPFYGRVERVPEQRLWFGLTSHFDDEDSVIGATDLTVDPWSARVVWTDDLPPPPHSVDSLSSHLVYLGRSRFCHARFFDIRIPYVGCSKAAVFTALEVERGANGELALVKHGSVQYNDFDYGCVKSVL
jgi:hypothetical protein